MNPSAVVGAIKLKTREGSKPIGATNSINQKKVAESAATLRMQIAEIECDCFLNSKFPIDFAQALIKKSFLKDHLSGFPHEEPALILGFNLHVMEKAVEHLCKNYTDPLEIAFIASKIAEKSSYDFINPRDFKKNIRYLSAAKQMGYFFTPPEIALIMAGKILKGVDHKISILDPAAGMGVLLASTMVLAAESNVEISSINGIETDEFTAKNLKKVLNRIGELCEINCEINVENADAIELLSRPIIFNNKDALYDRIIMNPPYGRLRFLRSSLTNNETRVTAGRVSLELQESEWKKRVADLNENVKQVALHLGIGSGLQEFSRVFLALSLEHLKEGGSLAIISPSSWLGDKDSYELRKSLIQHRWIKEITLFREDSDLFETVNQPTAISVIRKSQNEAFLVISAENKRSKASYGCMVDFKLIESIDPVWLKIPRISGDSIEVYKQLRAFKTIAQVPHLKNARGELDLSFCKHLVCSDETQMRMIRGDHVERFVTKSADKSDKHGFVLEKDFQDEFRGLPKFKDTMRYRIVGRQCSYMDKARRLSFSLTPPNTVVSNSCNYLYFDDDNMNESSENLLATLGMLNSIVLEWYFRVFNSNNHVANYEIDDFPIALDNKLITAFIARSTKLLLNAYKNNEEMSSNASMLENLHDALVANAYGLSPEMIFVIASQIAPDRAKIISHMTAEIQNGELPELKDSVGWFNHFISRLSNLDCEIIRHVPQGGNWMNIPESVPSQRLKQIRDMTKERGVVRTTYYGRLKPDQPAYTIATYFNRPGNGTNIHPWENRTISLREAARLQSFPDHYIFLGSEGSIRKQIGNAVPPLLAYGVGKHLNSLKGNGTCVDAFAGTGGLSLGLEMAKWDVICAFDNDKWASKTYCFNRPSTRELNDAKDKTLFMERDMFEEEVQEELVKNIKSILAGKELDLLVGGPPCQGFSHAGFRKQDDRRNNLASIYLAMAAELRPNTILLENVEGLLSFNEGQVVRDLLATLKELGYQVAEKPWVLCAEQFGVPQMRRRVMIVANKNQVVEPPNPFFQRCAGRRENAEKLSLEHLPYPFTVADAMHDLDPLSERVITSMGSRPLQAKYSLWLKGFVTTEELLEIYLRTTREPTLMIAGLNSLSMKS